jgi:hypothetical protein
MWKLRPSVHDGHLSLFFPDVPAQIPHFDRSFLFIHFLVLFPFSPLSFLTSSTSEIICPMQGWTTGDKTAADGIGVERDADIV